MATVRAVDAATSWLEVVTDGSSGWITSRYAAEVVPCPDPQPAVVADAVTHYEVGSWNLEHFHDGAQRGFPENTDGGPSYPSRTPTDLAGIAAIIEDLSLKVIVLEEINGEPGPDGKPRSVELERLIDILGTDNYAYAIAESGDAQRVALLYDRRAARLNAVCETSFPNDYVDGKRLFDRQPLFGHFTFLVNGQPRNDLLVVGVHLASGQAHTKNHDQAMKTITEKILDARAEEWCVPADEHDVLITGDFNASRFDTKKEKFWDQMEAQGWDVLAEDGYPATRLAGIPLTPRSVIDYVIVSADGNHALIGEEVTGTNATVHHELLTGGADAFRSYASDHLPVTVKVRIMEDTDGE
ncbi:MAG: endonuclease/exonuclease/phosphatase family protein [Myxococcota bacterium]